MLRESPPLPPPVDRSPSLGPQEPLYALRPAALLVPPLHGGEGVAAEAEDLRDVWIGDDAVPGGVALGAAQGIALLLPGEKVRAERDLGVI